MARLHIRQRSDHRYGLYKGKTVCLAIGTYDEIVPIGRAIKEKRRHEKRSKKENHHG